MLLRDVGAVALGYLLGSCPFAHWITRWRTGLRIRQVGDGNVGARNVFHIVGPTWGTLVGLLDGMKGLAAVLVARLLGGSLAAALLAGPAAVLGHWFPLFLRFQGGKGLATALGVMLAWSPWSTLVGVGMLGVAQFFLRNFDRSVVFGAATAIFLPPLFGRPWTLVLYNLVVFCALAVRKLIDLPHERRTWARSGWRDAPYSDWYDAPAGGAESASRPAESGKKSG